MDPVDPDSDPEHCLAADAALEGPLLAVHAGVHVQATGVRVRLTAHSTLKIIPTSWNKNN